MEDKVLVADKETASKLRLCAFILVVSLPFSGALSNSLTTPENETQLCEQFTESFEQKLKLCSENAQEIWKHAQGLTQFIERRNNGTLKQEWVDLTTEIIPVIKEAYERLKRIRYMESVSTRFGAGTDSYRKIMKGVEEPMIASNLVRLTVSVLDIGNAIDILRSHQWNDSSEFREFLQVSLIQGMDQMQRFDQKTLSTIGIVRSVKLQCPMKGHVTAKFFDELYQQYYEPIQCVLANLQPDSTEFDNLQQYFTYQDRLATSQKLTISGLLIAVAIFQPEIAIIRGVLGRLAVSGIGRAGTPILLLKRPAIVHYNLEKLNQVAREFWRLKTPSQWEPGLAAKIFHQFENGEKNLITIVRGDRLIEHQKLQLFELYKEYLRFVTITYQQRLKGIQVPTEIIPAKMTLKEFLVSKDPLIMLERDKLSRTMFVTVSRQGARDLAGSKILGGFALVRSSNPEQKICFQQVMDVDAKFSPLFGNITMNGSQIDVSTTALNTLPKIYGRPVVDLQMEARLSQVGRGQFDYELMRLAIDTKVFGGEFNASSVISLAVELGRLETQARYLFFYTDRARDLIYRTGMSQLGFGEHVKVAARVKVFDASSNKVVHETLSYVDVQELRRALKNQ